MFNPNDPKYKVINTIWNWETIRDFCGSFYEYQFMVPIDPAQDRLIYKRQMLYRLPDAVNDIVKLYHKQFIADTADENIKFLKDQILKKLHGIIPLDSSKWNDEDIVQKVYDTIYFHNRSLEQVARTYYKSDEYRAGNYIINYIEDEEVKKILLKAISGHKPDNKYIDKVIFNMTFDGIIR